MISRSGTEYVNEPAVTGGNPVLSTTKGTKNTNRQRAGATVMFNDMLGNTLGVAGKDEFSPINRTAFGRVVDNQAWLS